MIIRMRLRAGAAIPGRLSTHPLCPRSPGTGPSEQSTTQQQRRTRLPPAAPTTKSPAQDGISIESHPRSSTEPRISQTCGRNPTWSTPRPRPTTTSRFHRSPPPDPLSGLVQARPRPQQSEKELALTQRHPVNTLQIERVLSVFGERAMSARVPEPPPELPTVFIGHGRSPLWRDLKDHLQAS